MSINFKNFLWPIVAVFSIFLTIAIFWLLKDSFTSFFKPDIKPTRNIVIPQPLELPKQLEAVQPIKTGTCSATLLIDGTCSTNGVKNSYPVAVVIDNQIDALPQSGINQASIVYESLVEGGVTRLLAIFTPENLPANLAIGPIRSARPYFVVWADEVSAVFAHVGGSPAALAYVSQNNTIDLNEFYNADYFGRSSTRNPPHNVYTTIEKLNRFLAVKKLQTGVFLEWRFKKEEPVKTPHKSIQIQYPVLQYGVKWTYDKDTNSYFRSIGGDSIKDSYGQDVTAKNIIIEYLEIKDIDEEGRIVFNLTGAGEALFCMDGICQEGIWKKETEKTRTRFYTKSLQEINFNPGKTWINVINKKMPVKIQ